MTAPGSRVADALLCPFRSSSPQPVTRARFAIGAARTAARHIPFPYVLLVGLLPEPACTQLPHEAPPGPVPIPSEITPADSFRLASATSTSRRRNPPEWGIAMPSCRPAPVTAAGTGARLPAEW